MAKRKKLDSPLLQTLHQLEAATVRRGRLLQYSDGEHLWHDVQEMVAEAGGVHQIPIEAAYIYCLLFRASETFRGRQFNEALSAVHDYMSHPQVEQDTNSHWMHALSTASNALLGLYRLDEALEKVLELLSERFNNRRNNREALYFAGHIFQRALRSSMPGYAHEEKLPPGWAEAIERWAKRKKRSKTTRRWLSENPTNQELLNLVDRVWL